MGEERKGPHVRLLDDEQLSRLNQKVERNRSGGASRRGLSSEWYWIAVPMAHRAAGKGKVGYVLVLAASEEEALDLMSSRAPGVQRSRPGSVRKATAPERRAVEALHRRDPDRRVWSCWQIEGTGADDY